MAGYLEEFLNKFCMENKFENQEEINKKFEEILEVNELKDLLENAKLNEIAVSAIVETYKDFLDKKGASVESLNEWLKETLGKYNINEKEVDRILREINKEKKDTYINPEITKYSSGLRRKIDFLKSNQEEGEKENKENKENKEDEDEENE